MHIKLCINLQIVLKIKYLQITPESKTASFALFVTPLFTMRLI